MNLFYGENPSSASSKSIQNSQSLGIYTKSPAILTPQGFQRVHDYLLQDQSRKLLPKERVSNCRRLRIDKMKPRTVMYNENRCKAHFGNVQICGSIWSCPICAKHITEQRRTELRTGLDRWKTGRNGSVYLLTLTFSHSHGQSLRILLEGQKKAYKRFFEGRKVVAIFKKLGVEYKIKGQEVTYGQNGWHPHNHVLLLATHHDLRFESYISELAEQWISACIKSGLNAPSMQHGLDLRNGYYADQYVAKWGIENELTKGHIKKGRNGSYTPFDLLQLSTSDEIVHGRSSGKLFQEFALAMKGARQLVWARGLKALLEIEDKSDEELAEETDKTSITLTPVEDLVFSLLCTYQKRHEYLEAITRDYESGCFGNGEAENLINDLVQTEIRRLENAY
ncbi:protein rep [Acinetobacter baumannii]|nr:protein rep [Acinetobacter baumannii]EAM4439542.1 rolling circle replication protein, Rep63 protein [Salmonella enterica subsp. enterica serovar Give]MMT98252.1 rolling circle replication protein, Rep63 protein [Salmonella enterica subsp. enterica serovar Minnesota]EHU3103707.1 protein rep [Acinetobacter baumannii]EHU3112257.1 protein rep [Acinetobacter baumannii]EIB6940580.1 protein rep [Acinetobacter baumannii]